MRHFLLFIFVVLTTLSGCEENLDPATLEGAMHRLQTAVMARDTEGLLALTSAATRTHLAELHTVLKEQRHVIEKQYPEAHRAAARTAYPKGVLKAKDTNDLFKVLVAKKLDALELSEGLSYGLTLQGLPVKRESATRVTTQAGESLDFVFEAEVWVTTAFEQPIEQSLDRVKLNQQTLLENLKVFEELKRREAKKRAKAAKPVQP